MIKEAIEKVLSLAPQNISQFHSIDYTDKHLTAILPPEAETVNCSTLQGLVDLHDGELDDAKIKGDLLVHIISPTTVKLISRESDLYGRRRTWAKATYPEGCTTFKFGAWHDPENFIISAQASFQRALIEGDDGKLAQDLDYVLKIASSISAESVQSNDDDGIAQRVATKSGVVLKAQTVLRPLVNLAPYRTFAEIDQVLSRFVFRARIGSDSVNLALFEGDGGRWRLAAVDAISKWLQPKFGDVPVIS